MGNCCKIKTIPYKYSEAEDWSTHRNDGIVLLSDDNLTSLSSNLNTWVLGQEFTLSLYTDYTLTSTFLTTERVRSLCTTPSLLAYGGKSITILDYSGNERGKLTGHERLVTCQDISGNQLISGSSDWSLRLWDLCVCKEITRNVINWNVVTAVKWHEGSIVQTSEDLRLRIWDVREDGLSPTAVVSVGDNFATCCDVKDNYIVTGHRGFDTEGCEAKLWDFRKAGVVAEMTGHSEAVEGVRFVGEGIVTCGKDGKLIHYNMNGAAKYTWQQKNKKPFIVMERFKEGILAGSIEPKIYYFSINPFIHEA